MKKIQFDLDTVTIPINDSTISKLSDLPKEIYFAVTKYSENEEGLYLQNGMLKIDNTLIAQCSNFELGKLGLAPELPYRIHISFNSTPLTKNFKINFKIKDNQQRDIVRFEYKGVNIKVNDEEYTLSDPYYSFIKLIDKINNNNFNKKSEKLSLIEELKKNFPEDIKLEGNDFLNNFSFVKVDTFSIDFKNETNDLKVLPCFNKSLRDFSMGEFQEQFHQKDKVNDFYKPGQREYVLISPNLKKALKVLKKVQKCSLEEKRSFIANPMSWIVEDEQYDEEIESVFIETENFLSDRISHLGIWEPKSGVYIPPTNISWIPSDHVIIKLEKDTLSVSPHEIKEIEQRCKQAKKNGESEIDFGDKKIRVTEKNLSIISNVVKKEKELISIVNEKQKLEKNSTEKSNREKLVAIIKDNIEEKRYSKKITRREELGVGNFDSWCKFESIYPYQKNGINWLGESYREGMNGVLLADDMGLGKTAQVLLFLKWLKNMMEKKEREQRPILIVGPTGLLKNWEKEHQRTLTNRGLGRLLECFGYKFLKLRKESFNLTLKKMQRADWVMTTYETLRDQQEYFRKISWATVVFDEIQKIKNPNSAMANSASTLEAKFWIGLSGTPVENNLTELWSVVDCLLPSFLGTLKEFSTNYCKNETKEKLEELYKKLTTSNLEFCPKPFMLRREKAEYLTGLPKKKEFFKKYEMQKEQADRYLEIRNQVVSGEIKKGIEAIQKLKRFSLYLDSVDEIDDEYINKCARLKGTIEILKEIQERKEKVLIFLENRELQGLLKVYLQKRFNFFESIKLINGTMNSGKRQNVIDNFKDKEEGFDILIISPKAGGVGFTITEANNVIHLERCWNPSLEAQCNDRV